MKKLVIAIMMVFLVVGCGNMMDTPTKKVEQFLSKYQTMDKKVLDQLDEVIDSAGTMVKEHKDKYRSLMKKQYQNLAYKIKEETVDGNNATVEVEVEVYDYATSITESETHLTTNKKDFIDEKTKEVDDEKFMGYKLDQLEKIKNKVKYTINFTLTKKDNNWELDDITEIDRQKLHGLYS